MKTKRKRPIENESFPKPRDQYDILGVGRPIYPKNKISVDNYPFYAVAFGFNSCCKVGNATLDEVPYPRQVQRSKKQRYISCSAGKFHSVLVSDEGNMYSFGDGRRHQLGYPSEKKPQGIISNQITPKQVNPSGSYKLGRDLRITQVSCGDFFTIGREMSPEEGVDIIVGLRDMENAILRLKKIFYDSEKVQWTWSMVRQERFAVQLMSEGQLVSWGEGKYGELGLGPYTTILPSPTVLPKLFRVPIISVAAGSNHVLAVSNDAHLYSWGQGSSGQLGHGDFENRYFPTIVKFYIPYFVESCASGARHSAVIVTSRKGLPRSQQLRRLSTFGRGSLGRLGHGHATASQSLPKVVERFPIPAWAWNEYRGRILHAQNSSLSPSNTTPGSNNKDVNSSASSAAKKTHDEDDFEIDFSSSSSNHFDQNSSSLPPNLLSLVACPRQVACGSCHTLVLATLLPALPPSQANPWGQRTLIYSFGGGKWGQLGVGNVEDSSTPLLIRWPHPLEIVCQVSAGRNWSLARTLEGQLYSWGMGHRGQLAQEPQGIAGRIVPRQARPSPWQGNGVDVGLDLGPKDDNNLNNDLHSGGYPHPWISLVPRKIDSFGCWMEISSGPSHGVGLSIPKKYWTSQASRASENLKRWSLPYPTPVRAPLDGYQGPLSGRESGKLWEAEESLRLRLWNKRMLDWQKEQERLRLIQEEEDRKKEEERLMKLKNRRGKNRIAYSTTTPATKDLDETKIKSTENNNSSSISVNKVENSMSSSTSSNHSQKPHHLHSTSLTPGFSNPYAMNLGMQSSSISGSNAASSTSKTGSNTVASPPPPSTLYYPGVEKDIYQPPFPKASLSQDCVGSRHLDCCRRYLGGSFEGSFDVSSGNQGKNKKDKKNPFGLQFFFFRRRCQWRYVCITCGIWSMCYDCAKLCHQGPAHKVHVLKSFPSWEESFQLQEMKRQQDELEKNKAKKEQSKKPALVSSDGTKKTVEKNGKNDITGKVSPSKKGAGTVTNKTVNRNKANSASKPVVNNKKNPDQKQVKAKTTTGVKGKGETVPIVESSSLEDDMDDEKRIAIQKMKKQWMESWNFRRELLRRQEYQEEFWLDQDWEKDELQRQQEDRIKEINKTWMVAMKNLDRLQRSRTPTPGKRERGGSRSPSRANTPSKGKRGDLALSNRGKLKGNEKNRMKSSLKGNSLVKKISVAGKESAKLSWKASRNIAQQRNRRKKEMKKKMKNNKLVEYMDMLWQTRKWKNHDKNSMAIRRNMTKRPQKINYANKMFPTSSKSSKNKEVAAKSTTKGVSKSKSDGTYSSQSEDEDDSDEDGEDEKDYLEDEDSLWKSRDLRDRPFCQCGLYSTCCRMLPVINEHSAENPNYSYRRLDQAVVKIQKLARSYLYKRSKALKQHQLKLIRLEACSWYWENAILNPLWKKLQRSMEQFQEHRENEIMAYEDRLKHQFDYYSNLQGTLGGLAAVMHGVRALVGRWAPQVMLTGPRPTNPRASGGGNFPVVERRYQEIVEYKRSQSQEKWQRVQEKRRLEAQERKLAQEREHQLRLGARLTGGRGKAGAGGLLTRLMAQGGGRRTDRPNILSSRAVSRSSLGSRSSATPEEGRSRQGTSGTSNNRDSNKIGLVDNLDSSHIFIQKLCGMDDPTSSNESEKASTTALFLRGNNQDGFADVHTHRSSVPPTGRTVGDSDNSLSMAGQNDISGSQLVEWSYQDFEERYEKFLRTWPPEQENNLTSPLYLWKEDESQEEGSNNWWKPTWVFSWVSLRHEIRKLPLWIRQSVASSCQWQAYLAKISRHWPRFDSQEGQLFDPDVNLLISRFVKERHRENQRIEVRNFRRLKEQKAEEQKMAFRREYLAKKDAKNAIFSQARSIQDQQLQLLPASKQPQPPNAKPPPSLPPAPSRTASTASVGRRLSFFGGNNSTNNLENTGSIPELRRSASSVERMEKRRRERMDSIVKWLDDEYQGISPYSMFQLAPATSTSASNVNEKKKKKTGGNQQPSPLTTTPILRRHSLCDPSNLSNRLTSMKTDLLMTGYARRRDSLPVKLSQLYTIPSTEERDMAKEAEEAEKKAEEERKNLLSGRSASNKVMKRKKKNVLTVNGKVKESLELFQLRQDLLQQMVRIDESPTWLEMSARDQHWQYRKTLQGCWCNPRLPMELSTLLRDNERRRTVGEPERLAGQLHRLFSVRNDLAILRRRVRQVETLPIRRRSYDWGELQDQFQGITSILSYDFGEDPASQDSPTLSQVYRDSAFMEARMILAGFLAGDVHDKEKEDMSSVGMGSVVDGHAATQGGGHNPYAATNKRKTGNNANNNGTKSMGISGAVGVRRAAQDKTTILDTSIDNFDSSYHQGTGWNNSYGQEREWWEEHYTPEGATYYYNSQTQESRWERPEGPHVEICVQYESEDGYWYWYNTVSGETWWVET